MLGLYNFIIIEQVLIFWVKSIHDMSGEFKIMHSTLSNLLFDLPNGKYILKYIYIYIYIYIHVKNIVQTDPTCNLIDMYHF